MTPHHRRYIMSIATLFLVPTMGGGHILAQQNQASMNENLRDANPSKSPDTSKWKLYRNEKYGFQLKYPETWAVSSSRGTSPEIIYFSGPYRGVIGRALNVAVQLNMNPRKLSIEEWFAEQMRVLGAKPESTGRSIIGGQTAIFMENTNSFGKQRDTFTLLHKIDVLSFNYTSGTADDPTYASIIESFRLLK